MSADLDWLDWLNKTYRPWRERAETLSRARNEYLRAELARLGLDFGTAHNCWVCGERTGFPWREIPRDEIPAFRRVMWLIRAGWEFEPTRLMDDYYSRKMREFLTASRR